MVVPRALISRQVIETFSLLFQGQWRISRRVSDDLVEPQLIEKLVILGTLPTKAMLTLQNEVSITKKAIIH